MNIGLNAPCAEVLLPHRHLGRMPSCSMASTSVLARMATRNALLKVELSTSRRTRYCARSTARFKAAERRRVGPKREGTWWLAQVGDAIPCRHQSVGTAKKTDILDAGKIKFQATYRPFPCPPTSRQTPQRSRAPRPCCNARCHRLWPCTH